MSLQSIAVVSLATLAACWPTRLSAAVLVDDFSDGPLSLTVTDSLLSQRNLDPDRVASGVRHLDVSRGPVSLEVSDGAFVATTGDAGRGYFTLMYGLDEPLGLDFTSDGHDRLLIRFGEIDPNGLPPMWFSVNTELPPRSNAPGPSRTSIPSAGGVYEIPFSSYPEVDFTDVSTFAIDVIRMNPGASFTIEEVRTAGPPLAGDYNRDGVVDEQDLDEWTRFFGRGSYSQFAGRVGPDGNGDLTVDLADYTIWRDAFLATRLSTPEPGTALLAALFCVPMSIRRRRRR